MSQPGPQREPKAAWRPGARWAWWVALLSRRETGEALALMRILTGVAVILNMGTAIGFDMVDFIWIDLDYGGYRHVGGNWLIKALGGPVPGVVWPLVILTLIAGVTLTLGVLSRPSALIAAQGLLAIASINSHAKGSYDGLLVNSLWILVFAQASATLSLGCRLRTGRWTSDASVAFWPRLLAITQIVIVYTSTGLHKLSMSWTPGGGYSALYFILQQPSWHRGDMTWTAWPVLYQLTQLATAITWFWEVTFWMVAVTLYLRDDPQRAGRVRAFVNKYDLRLLYAAIGVALHSTVAMLMVVGPFWWITLAYYPCLFHPRELRAFAARLRRRAA